MVKHQRTFVVFETTSNVNSFVRVALRHSTTLFSDFPAFYTYMYACIIVRTCMQFMEYRTLTTVS